MHHIVVDYCDEDPESSSFINSYKNIPLEASSTESLINDIEKVLFTQHRIFIVDRIGNKVIMFDEKGNFLKSTAKMVGRGHNEYIRVIDAAVDEKEGKLYVHCDAPYQTMVFDLDLNVKKIIPLDYFMTEISIDDQFLYGLRHNEGQPAGFNLIAIPKDHLEAVPDTVLTYDKGIPGLLTMGKMLNACQDGIYVSMAFDNVIYRMGIGASRAQARQLVNHAHFSVNGRTVNVPSYIVKAGDVIAVKENRKKDKYFEQIKTMKVGNMPKWLEFDPEKLEGKILALPAREDIDSQIAEHMIVELYSK